MTYRTVWSRTGRLRGSLVGMPLSPREQDSLVAYVNAGSFAGAAKDLGRSPLTVRNLVRRAVEKLGAKTTTHAAAIAYPDLKDRYQVGL